MSHAAVTVSVTFFNHKTIYITTIDFNMKSFKMQCFPVSDIYCIHFYKFNDHHCEGDYRYYKALKGSGYILISICYANKAMQNHLFSCLFVF